MFGFTIASGGNGEIKLWLGEDCLAYLMVSKLIEGEAIGGVLYLLGIFLVGGKEIMTLLKMLDGVVLFQCADASHLV